MKRFAAIAAVALGVVSGASAKAPLSGFRVCGVASCVAITGSDAEIIASNTIYFVGRELPTGPPPASFYALHWIPNGTRREQTAYYVSSAGTLAIRGHAPTVAPGWTALNADAQLGLERVTASLEPFAAPRLTRAIVGRKAVRDPSGYDVLWTLGTSILAGYQWPRAGWLSVRVFTDVPSPWQGTLLIGRRANLLMRDGNVYSIPARVGARIRARASLP